MTEIERLTLVLGGARSGKSRHAEALVTALPGPWLYLATAEARDAEMAARIAAHQARRGTGWTVVEEPLRLADAVAKAPDEAPILIDCLTLWLTNLMLAGEDWELAAEAVLAALEERKGAVVAVSNEVGLGIVPTSELGRDFRDQAGRLNQRFAARAGTVVVMIAGLPLSLKQNEKRSR